MRSDWDSFFQDNFDMLCLFYAHCSDAGCVLSVHEQSCSLSGIAWLTEDATYCLADCLPTIEPPACKCLCTNESALNSIPLFISSYRSFAI